MNSNTKPLTNTKNLPNFLVQSFQEIRDEYSKGEADFSVTDFLKPIHQKRLQEQCLGDISEDASDMYYSVRGTALHHRVLDKMVKKNGYMVEERFSHSFPGVGFVSGQMDIYDTERNILYDLKETSVWSIVNKDKDKPKSKMDDWAFQLNAYRLLMCYERGLDATGGLKIVAFLRDWQKTKAKFEKGYPKSDIQIVDIPYLPDHKVIERMEGYVKEYRGYDMSGEYPMEGRWQKPAEYAVKKKGRKSAIKVHKTEGSALSHIGLLEKGQGHFIEERPSEPKRCMEYCNVSGKCAFYKKYQESLNE